MFARNKMVASLAGSLSLALLARQVNPLDAVAKMADAEGWAYGVVEDDGSKAWFFRDFEDDAEREQWLKDGRATAERMRARFPGFEFSVNDSDSMHDPEGSGTVYIDVCPAEPCVLCDGPTNSPQGSIALCSICGNARVIRPAAR